MANTSIEWCTDVWNPTAGCDRVSPGCDHCYALTMAKRLKGMGQSKYALDGDPKTSGPGFLAHEWPSALDWPLTVKKPMRVFVNSMSDLFHDNISDEFIAQVFSVMGRAHQHTFQVLTKRHGRMRSLMNSPDFRERVWELNGVGGRFGAKYPHFRTWPQPNVWLGVSVENQQWADIRIPALLDTPAAVRFLSCEPLLGPVSFRWAKWQPFSETAVNDQYDGLRRIDWVIVGGESGPGARPMHPDWARSLRDQCVAADVAFLFKQWGEWAPAEWKPERAAEESTSDYIARAEAVGATHAVTNPLRDGSYDLYEAPHKPWSVERVGGCEPYGAVRRVGKKSAGREIDGRTWDEYPAVADV